MSSKPKYTRRHSAANKKLQEITKDLKAPDSKRADVKKQVKIINAQLWQQDEDELAPDGLERQAELALNEELVELFEKVCDWCKLESVKEEGDLKEWSRTYEWLRNVVHYRAGHSIKLGTRLANSKQYFKSIEMYIRWHINTEKDIAAMIKNTIILCDSASNDLNRKAVISIGSRNLYNQQVCISTIKQNTFIPVILMDKLSILSTVVFKNERKYVLIYNVNTKIRICCRKY